MGKMLNNTGVVGFWRPKSTLTGADPVQISWALAVGDSAGDHGGRRTKVT